MTAPAEQHWTRGRVLYVRTLVVIAAAGFALTIGGLDRFHGTSLVGWALPLLLITTAVALSWNAGPSSPPTRPPDTRPPPGPANPPPPTR